MTVGELIQELSKYPSNQRVVISGYEGGFVDVTSVHNVEIMLNVLDEWYYGPHSRRGVHDEGPADEIAVEIE